MKSAAVMIAAIVAWRWAARRKRAPANRRPRAWRGRSPGRRRARNVALAAVADRPAVQMRCRGLIVSSGAEPKIVVAALDQALASCKPIGTSIARVGPVPPRATPMRL